MHFILPGKTIYVFRTRSRHTNKPSIECILIDHVGELCNERPLRNGAGSLQQNGVIHDDTKFSLTWKFMRSLSFIFLCRLFNWHQLLSKQHRCPSETLLTGKAPREFCYWCGCARRENRWLYSSHRL